jgi:hypothetical protein
MLGPATTWNWRHVSGLTQVEFFSQNLTAINELYKLTERLPVHFLERVLDSCQLSTGFATVALISFR